MSDTGIAADQLKVFVNRIEKLLDEKEELTTDISEVYAEAKAMGFCTKTLRKVLAVLRKTEHERQEEEAMLELYLNAVKA